MHLNIEDGRLHDVFVPEMAFHAGNHVKYVQKDLYNIHFFLTAKKNAFRCYFALSIKIILIAIGIFIKN